MDGCSDVCFTSTAVDDAVDLESFGVVDDVGCELVGEVPGKVRIVVVSKRMGQEIVLLSFILQINEAILLLQSQCAQMSMLSLHSLISEIILFT